MKNRRFVTWGLACIPLIIVLLVLPALPDTIPAHFDIAGNVNRFGSKYELLILPIVTIAMGLFWLLMEKIALKDTGRGQQNAKALFWSNIVMTLTFMILTIWFLSLAYNRAENIYQNGFDFMKLLAVVLSLGWVIIGNLLPKCKQNALIGIRTKWTLASETVWYKTHRWGGRLIFVTGIISAVLCLLVFDGMLSLFVSVGCLVIVVIPIILYSYRAYKKLEENGNPAR
jgi:uncharacterized membrane protein